MRAIEAALERARLARASSASRRPPATREQLAARPPAPTTSTRSRSSARRGGGMIDLDTVASRRAPSRPRCTPPAAPPTPPSGCSAGDADFAFCGLRPPGHHAERDRAMGFCLFNNVAVAAAHALDGVRRRAGADPRLGRPPRQRHRGDLRRRRPRCSTRASTSARCIRARAPRTRPASGDGARATRVNLPVPPGAGADEFLALVQHVVAPIARALRAPACSRSRPATTPTATTRSPTASCDDGGLRRRWRRRCASSAAELGAPVLVCLEGGYDRRRAGGVGGRDGRGPGRRAAGGQRRSDSARRGDGRPRWRARRLARGTLTASPSASLSRSRRRERSAPPRPGSTWSDREASRRPPAGPR